MKPWTTLAQSREPNAPELRLQERDGVFVIRAGGHVLMSSAQRGSEESLATVGLAHLSAAPANVLLGGLGLGFTVRAALALLNPRANVVVAEISPAVVAWNRGPLAHLANSPLEDPRVVVKEEDVAQVAARETARFDAILLDVDNGPSALAREENSALYGERGLKIFRQALRPSGRLVVWSAGSDARFLERLRKAGFVASEQRIPVRPGTRAKHCLFVATVPPKR